MQTRPIRFAELVAKYDVVFTYGGGLPVVEAYRAFGARACVPVYNAVDPETHFRVASDPRFAAISSFWPIACPTARRASKSSSSVRPASSVPAGASFWRQRLAGRSVPQQRATLGHVYTADHNAFNSTALAVLNVARDSMAAVGCSPATRVFEAAGAGACIVTDAWAGIDGFLRPGDEVIVASNGDDVARALRSLTVERARAIGEAARKRVLAEHTYAVRAAEVERHLIGQTRTQRKAAVS